MVDSTAVLEARNLSAGYHGSPVVRELDLTLRSGEVVCLLGSNGAGKSTTLLALAGELKALDGDVLVHGSKPAGSLHGRARQGVMLIPEERSVIPSLTVRDNLRLGPGSIDDALAIFPVLKPLLNRRGALLSGGEQQMLALARAMAARPKAILVDEVSLGLAPLAVRAIMTALRSAVDDWGLGALVVDQHLQTALTWADRGYVLSRGRKVMEGSSRELRERRDDVRASYLAGGVDEASAAN
ncbi:ATP-binding cassette domain-containing protein [Streptomyces sp. NPDC001982]|uniref:ABC transporter ATP-binding protein n=1 Tax=unclassified Streptomyces TaxID=2593676 RepID=UPI00333135C1